MPPFAKGDVFPQQNGLTFAKLQRQAGSLSHPPANPPAEGVPKPPPLFGRTDWLAFWAVTLVLLTAYSLTRAPSVTLEDAGELSVAAMYAGVPHPPGYPLWTLLAWLFTKLVPFGNMAWRISLFSGLATALAAGLIALIGSRGSTLCLENMEPFRNVSLPLRRGTGLVSGWVSGLLVGFNGFVWSQAVTVAVFPLTALALAGLMTSLMRWVYAPRQLRYLYLSWFLAGVSYNNEPSLLVLVLAIQVVVALAEPALGRDLFLGNVILWILVPIGMQVGALPRWWDSVVLDILQQCLGFGYGDYFERSVMVDGSLGVVSLILVIWLGIKTKRLFTELPRGFVCLTVFLAGVAFCFLLPVASMTNPPMNWAYARTVEGFANLVVCAPYERIQSTAPLITCCREYGHITAERLVDEFGIICLFWALVPFFFAKRMPARPRAWLIGVAVLYLLLGPVRLFLSNLMPDFRSLSLHKELFAPSHFAVALWIGFALAFAAAFLAAEYRRNCKRVTLALAGFAVLALYGLASQWAGTADLSLRCARIFGLGLALAAVLLLWLRQHRVPLSSLLAVFALLPGYAALNHWSASEQRGHLFGYWFGHDMFMPPFHGSDGKPLYPEMAKEAILFGGTDPGRFCPTYMIFSESFLPPDRRVDSKFDRRDVYIITQNALADGLYLNSIRGHYARSAQADPPFFSNLMRGYHERGLNQTTNLLARMLSPLDHLLPSLGGRIERDRRAGSSLFKDSDFLDLAGFARRLQEGGTPAGVSQYLYRNLATNTQELLTKPADPSLAGALARDFNRWLANEPLAPLYDPERFKGVSLSEHLKRFVAQNPQGHSRPRLTRLLIEESFPGQIARSPGGLYPDLEIFTPSNEDSQNCFQDFMAEARKRMEHDRLHPNEPPQIKPGQDVRVVGGRVQVSGQIAVMAINGLLSKLIFDRNTNHEFYVEESFPIDWMYPHLTPFGLIMKINRKPVPVLTREICERDHAFWSQYSQRLIGDWITYDTSVSDLCAFAQKVHLRHEYTGFTGDRRFIRDKDAPLAFSKLRVSIGGRYAWRLGPDGPPEYRPKPGPESQCLEREAEFAFKQAYAFCPDSPEVLHRFVNLLLLQGRRDEARLLAATTRKLDPKNPDLKTLLETLASMKSQPAEGMDNGNATRGQ
jgi:hypothetical protein